MKCISEGSEHGGGLLLSIIPLIMDTYEYDKSWVLALFIERGLYLLRIVDATIMGIDLRIESLYENLWSRLLNDRDEWMMMR